MAEKDLESEKLELSLFGRKRRKGKQTSSEQADTAVAAPDPVEPPAEPVQPTEPSEPVEPPEPAGSSTPARRAEPTVAAPVTSSGGATAVSDDTAALPTTATTAATATATSERTSAAGTTGPGRRRAAGSRRAGRTRGPRAQSATASRRSARVPSMAAPAAALVVGAVVGLAAVALTYASLKACELVTGTDSCGGPGLFVLLAVVVLMILGGSAALSLLGVPESGGLSFLGVAMFVALCLLVLLPSLLEPWMLVVAPVLCALCFAVAHWIVTRFDEDILETDGPQHDVR